jgi:hypothetical protein
MTGIRKEDIMRHQRWLKIRAALLKAGPEDGRTTLRRVPCTTLQGWLAHHAWHTAQEHFHGKELAADGDHEAHQAWAVAQQETAKVYDAVVEEFWQVRAACECLAHRVARDYRLIYTALTGEPLTGEPLHGEPAPEM